MAEEQWEVLSRTPIFDHPYLRVETEEIQLPDGRIIADWPKIYMPEFINAMVLNESGHVMVIEGYKHGVGRSSWQVLGGLIEAGETPLDAAQRELLEETGYHSPDWIPLGSHVLAANRHGGTGHFFLARHARQVQAPDHDDLEQFVVKWVAVSELHQALLLIWDGASYHRPVAVRAYLRDVNRDRPEKEWLIHCVQLAPHAPEQNPMEDVWLGAKNHVRKMWHTVKTFLDVNRYFTTFIDCHLFEFEKLNWYGRLQLI